MKAKPVKPVKCECKFPPTVRRYVDWRWWIQCAFCHIVIMHKNKTTAIRMWNAAMKEAKKG